jgi:chitinase
MRPVALALSLAACGGGAAGDDAEDGGDGSTGTSSSSAAAASEAGPGDTSVSTSAATAETGSSATDGTTSADGSTSSSDDTTTTGGETCVDDHRVVAFVANWTECPTAEQLGQYSHVVVSFAVTYTWDPGGNICDQSCTIGPIPGCNGQTLADLVAELHAADIEVLLSFGGAGMGGIWEGTCGQMTKCWDACIDQAASVADQLTDLVVENDLDGVDIDYEYCLSDASYTGFVTDLTTELRASLDAAFPGERKLVTHAPMDSELQVGDPYYAILETVADDIDFLMPQYYNGGVSPFTQDGLAAIEEHYGALVDGLFDGDASRVVFGFCIEPGCNPVATQPEAVAVMQTVEGWHPGNGGAFFWAHPDDTGAWFSQPLREYYDAAFCGD